MPVLLTSLIRPYLLRRPWQSLLAILGIALGVAVVVGIDLAATAALASFRGAVTAVTGNTTHQVSSDAGVVPDALLATLITRPEVAAATPVLSTTALVADQDNIPLRLLGIDPFTDFRFRAYSPARSGKNAVFAEADAVPGAFTRFLTEPDALVLARPFATSYHLKPGDQLALFIGNRPRRFTILALFDPAGPGAASAGDLALADLATIQEALARPNGLDRIDLILRGDLATQEASAATLQTLLPPGCVIERPAQRSAQTEQLISAFQLNLLALSLLSLFVGVFMISNTMLFAVVQRRQAIGLVRALGATREAVLGAFLMEAALLGCVGALVGIALGTGLAQYAVKLVGQTISDVYAYVRVDSAPLTWPTAIKGFALGVLASLVAAAGPAREAAMTPPRLTWLRSETERRATATLPLFTALGVGLLVAAALCAAWPGMGIPGGFAAAFLLASGFACFTPHVAIGLAIVLKPLVERSSGVLGVLAITNVGATLSRTGLAIAALMVALAMTIGVATAQRSSNGSAGASWPMSMSAPWRRKSAAWRSPSIRHSSRH
ncbi:MAG: FtsX-like permease family protein [bacterium]